ncbi:uncharacterized protein [Argopecten irradians]|uniref:uncharacterized protein n=1 Tax=Argopecten irradians TaxID=31199 RepID=UPI00371A9C10
MIITATKDTYVTTITGLRPDTLYNLSITASNSAGPSGQLRLQVSTSPACESVPLLASDPSTDTATALISVGVVCTVVGLICCGIGTIMYWKYRIVSRTDNRRKLETFSNAIEISPENNEENTLDSSHYQELQHLDIGKPSLYDHINSADDSGVPKAERDRSEQQQHTVTDHDYSNVK